MDKYFVSKKKNDNNYHEIHLEKCTSKGISSNYEDLGEHPNYYFAAAVAEFRGYRPIDGCFFCLPIYHKEKKA